MAARACSVGTIMALGWMDVSGWAALGGSELGAGRLVFKPEDLPGLAKILAQHDIKAMVIIGGMHAYENLRVFERFGGDLPPLQIPILAIPATINNNLPGTDFAIGAGTALNNVVSALDKIKDTAGANKRTFVVEVLGYDCGYLALMAALASGAEKVYLPEEGITLRHLTLRPHPGRPIGRGRGGVSLRTSQRSILPGDWPQR